MINFIGKAESSMRLIKPIYFCSQSEVFIFLTTIQWDIYSQEVMIYANICKSSFTPRQFYTVGRWTLPNSHSELSLLNSLRKSLLPLVHFHCYVVIVFWIFSFFLCWGLLKICHVILLQTHVISLLRAINQIKKNIYRTQFLY